MRWLLAAVAISALALPARAHVAPSIDDNNRYLKLTPRGDSVRLAYIVFFGEVPGAQLRPSIDANRNGEISEAEGAAFGTKLASEIAASLELTVDGAPRSIEWSEISVGMGTPRVAGGAFSVDLVASICITGRGRHALRLRDRFRLLRPGETEVRIEDAPGIAIDRAAIGDHPRRDAFTFTGDAAPLKDPGLELAFTTTDRAPASDGACRAPDRAGSRRWPIFAAAGAAALAAGAVVVARRKTRRRR